MDRGTGREDSGSGPFRPSPALEAPEYAQALELENSLALASVTLAATSVGSHL